MAGTMNVHSINIFTLCIPNTGGPKIAGGGRGQMYYAIKRNDFNDFFPLD